MEKKVNYKKVYCTFFQYRMTNDEWIPSEISNTRAIDIHHIYPKKMGGRKTFVHVGKTYDIDCIDNLIALTRDEHTAAHDPTNEDHRTVNELWNIHQKKIQGHRSVSKSIMNGK